MERSYIFFDEQEMSFRYGSGVSIYTERFKNGRLLFCNFQDNGIPIYEEDELKEVSSFQFSIDGKAAYFGWEFQNFQNRQDPKGRAWGTLSLWNKNLGVMLEIHTLCGDNNFYTRYLEITNKNDHSISLTSVHPFCGTIWQMKDDLRDNLQDFTVKPFSVGYYKDIHWGREGNFDWQEIPFNSTLSFGSVSGKSGNGNPFAVLRNNIYGGYCIIQMEWSSNWEFSFFNDFHYTADADLTLDWVQLSFSVSPVGVAPMRVIQPGEMIKSPVVHFALSHQDFDQAIQELHSYQRRFILRKWEGGGQPVVYNHWGFMQHEISEQSLKAEIDMAAAIGAEMFIVDAGWFGSKGTPWYKTTGDWKNGDRLPNDLFPVFEYARAKGLQVGLWAEIESAGELSRVEKEHPDWFIHRYGERIPRILDMAKPEVQAYAESEIIRLIERYRLDLFRLDYNNHYVNEGGFNTIDGYEESSSYKHVEAIYRIFERVRDKYPNIQLENCAGGGGRTDLGLVSRFTTTWISDWMRMPRTVRILNGMSLALPPEYINRMFGVVMNAHYRGNLDTMMHVVILSHASISGLTPLGTLVNPELLATVKKYLSIHKQFIRPFLDQSRVFHHTPVIPGGDAQGWCAIEYASSDEKRAVAGVFRLVNATHSAFTLKFKGLNPSLTYQVKVYPENHVYTVLGASLMQTGFGVNLDTALTSRLLLVEAVN